MSSIEKNKFLKKKLKREKLMFKRKKKNYRTSKTKIISKESLTSN